MLDFEVFLKLCPFFFCISNQKIAALMETAAARIAGIFFQMFKDMGTFQGDPRVQLGSPLLADTGAAAARCTGGQKTFLNQEDVRDSTLGEFKCGGTSNNASADNDDIVGFFHSQPPPFVADGS